MNYLWDISNTRTYNNRTGKYKFLIEFEFINKHINNTKEVLDICGGSGRFAFPLCAKVDKIKVVDVNLEALNLLQERSLKDMERKIEIEQIDFINYTSNQHYDLLLLIEALYYFEDKELLFKKVSDLMNSSSEFIFQYVNPSSWRFISKKLKNKLIGKKAQFHEIGFKELKLMLEKIGFTIEDIHGFNWIPLKLSSNSILVEVFAKIEKILKLYNWHSQSPWLMIAVKKA